MADSIHCSQRPALPSMTKRQFDTFVSLSQLIAQMISANKEDLENKGIRNITSDVRRLLLYLFLDGNKFGTFSLLGHLKAKTFKEAYDMLAPCLPASKKELMIESPCFQERCMYLMDIVIKSEETFFAFVEEINCSPRYKPSAFFKEEIRQTAVARLLAP
eukprot:gene6082-9163_t